MGCMFSARALPPNVSMNCCSRLRARRGSVPEDESLIRALAADLGLGDPLALDPAEPWTGPTPEALSLGPPASGRHLAGETPSVQASSWRTVGDTIERLE